MAEEKYTRFLLPKCCAILMDKFQKFCDKKDGLEFANHLIKEHNLTSIEKIQEYLEEHHFPLVEGIDDLVNQDFLASGW